MRVELAKRHIDSYELIAREVNEAIKKKYGLKYQKSKYERILSRKDISAENKKKQLGKSLHELIISTFSVNINNINKEILEKVRVNISLIRGILHKINAINNYLEEDFLRQLGIIKKSLILKAIKSNRPKQYLERRGRMLSKKYVDSIEYIVYELIQKILFFDKKLLRQYKKKDTRIIKTERFGINELEKIFNIESEILEALEAKMPPSSKVKQKLFKKVIFNKWVPMIFALLSVFEAEYTKEKLIFLKLKKDDGLRKKIECKIKHIVSEKERILNIKEKRVLSMKSIGKISDDYRQTYHEYISAASL